MKKFIDYPFKAPKIWQVTAPDGRRYT